MDTWAKESFDRHYSTFIVPLITSTFLDFPAQENSSCFIAGQLQKAMSSKPPLSNAPMRET